KDITLLPSLRQLRLVTVRLKRLPTSCFSVEFCAKCCRVISARGVVMSMIVVHPTDPQATVHSLTQALQVARTGDVILLNPGFYSPTRTGEVLPLRIPAGVTVVGAGKEVSIIDGEGLFEPSFNPVRPEVSVIVLDDGVTLSGVTVTNG